MTPFALVRAVRRILDNTGMYRLVTVALTGLLFFSLTLGALGLIPQGPLEQFRSLIVVLLACVPVNLLLAKLRGVSPNHESAVITALILFFLIYPAAEWESLRFIAIAGVAGMLSKYLIVWRGQHLLNPAAFGAAVLSVPMWHEAVWWISSPALFIPLAIASLAVALKVRKQKMISAFLATGFLVFLIEEWRFYGYLDNWELFWLSYPALFLGAFMITEPFTMPGRRRQQIAYACLVAVLAHTTIFMDIVALSPELALLMGNLAFFPFGLRRKLILTLEDKREIARNTYEFVFQKPSGMRFVAGQYLEWMLPGLPTDNRGPRRYFTIASSPTETVLRLACKIGKERSAYKDHLLNLKKGDTLIASQCAGDFVLPKEMHRKLGWIAGGIGITPFESQAKFMRDTRLAHDTVLFYGAQTSADLAYRETFEALANIYLIPVLADERIEGAETGYVDAEMIKRRAPDYLERAWYISGPPMMVNATYKTLRTLGVPKSAIARDFFPGLA